LPIHFTDLEIETNGKVRFIMVEVKTLSVNEQSRPSEEENKQTDLKTTHVDFSYTLLLAIFAAMIGTGAQFGYALGVMNAPSEVKI
jgi:hypothetical protein